MFIKLEEKQYSNVAELLDYVSYDCVFAFAVIEKSLPGQVYVDDVTAPKSALICSIHGKYLVLGDETNIDFNKALFQFLKDKTNHVKYYDLYTSSDEWLEILGKALNGQAVFLKHSVYHYDNSKNILTDTNSIQLSEELVLKPIDEILFQKIADEFNSSFKYHWNSPHGFYSSSFGYCITKENEIVAEVDSCYTGNGFAEINILTRDNFRRQGLAFNLCKKFIAHCKENNLKALWVCDYGNKPSNELAKKLGFTKAKDIEILWWHENPGIMAGYLNKFNYL